MFQLKYEEIIEKIKEKGLSEEEINRRIEEKISRLNDLISKEGAAHILANELGIKLYDLEKREFKIKDLIVGMRGIEINGRVLQKYDVIEYKKENREGRIFSFLIGDENASTRIVVWDESQINELSELDEGDIVKIKNGYVRENRNGYKEIHLNKDSEYEINPDGVEIGEFEGSIREKKIKKIKDLQIGEIGSFNGTIVQLFEPRYYDACVDCGKKVRLEGENYFCEEHGEVKNQKMPILNLFLDDGSDNIRVVAFRDLAEKILNGQGVDELREKYLGMQYNFTGRVVKNEMFDRLEFIAREMEELDAVEIAKELLK